MADEIVEIEDTDDLYRRLPHDHVKPDGRISSVAFCFRGQPDPSLSVDLAKLTTPEESIARAPKPGAGLGVFQAAVPRQLGLTVRHAPIPPNHREGRPPNPAHAVIEGLTPEDRLTRCYQLAERMRILVPPQRRS
jgi:hypothetical protein